MKNFVFVVIATIIFPFNVNAQDKDRSENDEKTESVYLSISSDNEVVKYRFDSIKDLQQNILEILTDITVNAEKSKGDKCKIAVELSFSISNGVVSTTITGVITAHNDEIVEEVKKMQNKLIFTLK